MPRNPYTPLTSEEPDLLACPGGLEAGTMFEFAEGAGTPTAVEAARLGVEAAGFLNLVVGDVDDPAQLLFVAKDETGVVVAVVSVTPIRGGFLPGEVRSCGFPAVEGVPFIQDREQAP